MKEDNLPKFEDMAGFKKIETKQKAKNCRYYLEMILLTIRYTIDFLDEYVIPFMLAMAMIQSLYNIMCNDSGYTQFLSLITLCVLFFLKKGRDRNWARK